MILLGGEAGLESSEGSAWGAQTEFPSCQRVGMSIPGRASEVSKDMQGTARETPKIWHSWPAKELLTGWDFTKQGFKDKWWAKDAYVPLSASFHKRNNRLAYTHQRASYQHKGHKWNTQLKETLTLWLCIFFSFCCRPVDTMSWAGPGLHVWAGLLQSSGRGFPSPKRQSSLSRFTVVRD